MSKKINISLPKEQRLGQIGVNKKKEKLRLFPLFIRYFQKFYFLISLEIIVPDIISCNPLLSFL